MPCSIQLHETPNNSTNYMTTMNDIQIPISGKENVATRTKPKLTIPPKDPTHLTKKYHAKHTDKFGKRDWNVY